MIIYVKNGSKREKIQTTDGGEPHWSAMHKRWYVGGYRWIKSRQAFSKSCLLHSFDAWTLAPNAVGFGW